MDINQHRQQFTGLANKTYFNFGGQGTMPKIALEAIVRAFEHIQQQGPFGKEINDWVTAEIAITRGAIAQELGTTPDTITLTENVTTGCNIALWGIDWHPGDQIVITDCEHPGVIATVGEISRRFQVEVVVCPLLETLNQGDPVAAVAQYLQGNTRLVVLSHLFWNTGQVLPLEAIVQLCHQHHPHPIPVLVDAAQSVGCLPLNLTELGADFYAFTGHKWWCGPAGVGGLYVRPESLEMLNPTFIGYRSVIVDRQGQPKGWKSDGSKFEVSTSSCPALVGLCSAIAYHQKWGKAQARYQQICQLSKYLWQGLGQIEGVECLRDSPPQGGLVSFQLPNPSKHQKFVESLEQQGFYLRTIANPSCIRACVHYFTLSEEIDRLLETIKQTYLVIENQ